LTGHLNSWGYYRGGGGNPLMVKKILESHRLGKGQKLRGKLVSIHIDCLKYLFRRICRERL